MYVMVGCRSKTVPGEIYISDKQQRASVVRCMLYVPPKILFAKSGAWFIVFSDLGFVCHVFFFLIGWGMEKEVGKRRGEISDVPCSTLG